MKEKKLILILSLFIITMVYIVYPYENIHTSNEMDIKKEVIRFHVIANSDSPEDQELKLKVRDEILSEVGEKFGDSSSIEESRSIIEKNMKGIKHIAEEEIKRQGKDYGVRVILGKDTFPTKSYGKLTLPAGEYEALKVIIGEGRGKNWWCVMFPPLCFVDINHGVSATSELNTVENSQQIRPKSKIVELFQKTKIQIGRMFK
jgi:stage II sporulation protein R